MPYSSNSELPSQTSALPAEAKTVFRRVFNNTLKSGKSEERAFATAWTAVKNAWSKNSEGKWEKLQKSDNDLLTNIENYDISVAKAEYQGREVELDKPFRTPGEKKKFAVYVKSGDSVKIVRFGDPNMEIKRDDKEARANFRARHSCDTATDKTTPRYWSCRMWSGANVSDIAKVDPAYESQIEVISEVFKANDEARLIYGWANKITKDGETVYDLQGDSISPEELLTATTEFMKSADRHSLNMHQGEPIGKVVHSFPLTYDIAKALGLETKDEGWLVGVHVTDDKTWEMVKSGDLAAFSIGGSALRKEIKE